MEESLGFVRIVMARGKFGDHSEFMVLALQLYDEYQKFILGVGSGRFMPRTYVPSSHVSVMFCVAGFRPGRRGPFVPEKVPKPVTPRPASLERRDASLRRADQLASLKQGPPMFEERPPIGPNSRRR